MFYRFAELAAVLGLGYLVVTQLLVPALLGKASFPMFRREKELLGELDNLKQQRVEQALAEQVQKESQTLKQDEHNESQQHRN